MIRDSLTKKEIKVDPVFPTGIFPDRLEYQHNLIRDVMSSMYSVIGNNRLMGIYIRKYREFRDRHVCLEEKYMIDLGYPRWEAHRVEHDRLMNIDEEVLRLDMGIGDITSIMSRWDYHIFVIDGDWEMWRDRKKLL